MQTRLVDLGLKLYDFIGVFIVLGTAAVLILFTGRILSHIKWSRSGLILSPVRIWDGPDLKFFDHPGFFRFKVNRRLQAIVVGFCYLALWIIVLVSFIVGMAKDVIFGLKILGFGSAGLVGMLSLLEGLLVAHSAVAKRRAPMERFLDSP